MVEGDNDGLGPRSGAPGGPGWELAKLIGRYETAIDGVDRRLAKIEESLETGNKAFNAINVTIAKKTEQLDALETRVSDVEGRNVDLSKRRRLQLDGASLAAILLTLKEIVVAILAAFH